MGSPTHKSLTQILQISKIAIVEWLGEKDLRTGEELAKYVGALITDLGRPLQVQLYRCRDRGAFQAALETLALDATRGQLPFIHIETHGDWDTGLGISNNDEVTWDEAFGALAKVNVATGLQLPVFIAACEAAGIWTVANPNGPAPALIIFAPAETLDQSDLLNQTRTFYRVLINTLDIDEAYRAVKTLRMGLREMAPLTAETWFKHLVQTFINEHASGEGLLQSNLRQQRKLREEGISKGIGAIRREYLLQLPKTMRRMFEAWFMVEKYPANAERFAGIWAGLEVLMFGTDTWPPIRRMRSGDVGLTANWQSLVTDAAGRILMDAHPRALDGRTASKPNVTDQSA